MLVLTLSKFWIVNAVRVINVPLFQSFDCPWCSWARVKCFAQIAKRLSVGFVKIADAVVRLPPEILGVQSVVSIEFCQIGGQLVRCVIQSVNVGMRRGDCGVVGSTQHDRHDVSLHHFEKFLRDVISADRVLKRQVEFVHFLDVVVTNVLVLLSGTHVFAAAFSAFTRSWLGSWKPTKWPINIVSFPRLDSYQDCY